MNLENICHFHKNNDIITYIQMILKIAFKVLFKFKLFQARFYYFFYFLL